MVIRTESVRSKDYQYINQHVLLLWIIVLYRTLWTFEQTKNNNKIKLFAIGKIIYAQKDRGRVHDGINHKNVLFFSLSTLKKKKVMISYRILKFFDQT